MNIIFLLLLSLGLDGAMCMRPSSMTEEFSSASSVAETNVNKTSMGFPNREECYAALKKQVLGHCLDSKRLNKAIDVMNHFDKLFLEPANMDLEKGDRNEYMMVMSLAIQAIVKHVETIKGLLGTACEKLGESETLSGRDWDSDCWGRDDGYSLQTERQKGSKATKLLGQMTQAKPDANLADASSGALALASWLLTLVQGEFDAYVSKGGAFYDAAVLRLVTMDGVGESVITWLQTWGFSRTEANERKTIKQFWKSSYNTLTYLTDKLSRLLMVAKYDKGDDHSVKQTLWELCQSWTEVTDAQIPTRSDFINFRTYNMFPALKKSALEDESLKDYVQWLLKPPFKEPFEV
mmetsp:Transcript_62356/g.115737  ORF Transcript_62356/g.115737 Transcript_62356/m.115737 type:complete len:350 (+) Transcript_62356:87-1136(+)